MSATEISLLLKSERASQHLSVKEVTSALVEHGISISEKTLYGYENGVSMPSANIFLALTRIYGVHNMMSAHERLLLDHFRTLNPEGQTKLVDYADDLVQSGKYIKSDPDAEVKRA